MIARVYRGAGLVAAIALLATSLQGTAHAKELAKPEKPAPAAASEATDATDAKRAAGALSHARTPKPLGPWKLELRSLKGRAVPVAALRSGLLPMAVVGKQYRLHAKVPSQLRKALRGATLVLEHRDRGEAGWEQIPTRTLKVRKGHIKARFTFPRSESPIREFRLRAIAPAARGLGVVAPMTSETVTAVGNISYTVDIYNDSKADLVVTLPGHLEGSSYTTLSFILPKGQTYAVQYFNPPDLSAFHMSATRYGGLFNTLYTTNWDYTPGGGSWTACSSSWPQFTSGQNYLVRLTGQELSSGFDGFMTGALDGPTDPSRTCTFSLDSGFTNWFINHPIVGYIAIALVAIVAAVIAFLCSDVVAAAYALLLAGEDVGGAVVIFADAADEVPAEVVQVAQDLPPPVQAEAIDVAMNGAVILA